MDPVRMSQDTFQRSSSQSENEKKLLVLSERAEARESQSKSTSEEVSCSGSEGRCSRNQHGVLNPLRDVKFDFHVPVFEGCDPTQRLSGGEEQRVVGVSWCMKLQHSKKGQRWRGCVSVQKCYIFYL